MPTQTLKRKLKTLPASPGVYLFKNKTDEVIYVGKAKILKNRMRSYFFQNHGTEPRTALLIANIADLEYIICDTETEALLLENNLIKKYQPRYNILLKDDKNFQFIKIDYSTEIPQIYTVRKLDQTATARPLPNPPLARGEGGSGKIPQIYTTRKIESKAPSSIISGRKKKIGNSKYYGPYTSGKSVRETLNLMRYILPYCGNKKIGTRPCFYYHLGRCPGVCFGTISLEEYDRYLDRIKKFLSGNFAATLKELKRQMAEASKKYLYEKAARLRDQISALEKMLEKQKIISPKKENFDAVSIFAAGNLAAVILFQIREGRLMGKESFILENAKAAPLADMLQAFAEKYYLQASDIPGEICTQLPLPEAAFLKKAIEDTPVNKITLSAPSRGRKRKLLKMGETNAKDYLHSFSQNLDRERAKLTASLFELKDRFGLPAIPLRIECYDISNIQGSSPTGSMAVFENGKAKKSDYKRFAIKTLSTPNDVGMMKEMLERRFSVRHSVRGEESRREKSSSLDYTRGQGDRDIWRLPDLIVVDGGRAQLNAALAVLKSKNLEIPAFGLAKRLEEIYRPDIKSPLRLPDNSAALHLLQRIRDEAHRFAVAYHRKKRSRKMLSGGET